MGEEGGSPHITRKTTKTYLMSPPKLFSMNIFGFVIRKNFPTSDPFDRDLVHILDSSKSLVDYIH